MAQFDPDGYTIDPGYDPALLPENRPLVPEDAMLAKQMRGTPFIEPPKVDDWTGSVGQINPVPSAQVAGIDDAVPGGGPMAPAVPSLDMPKAPSMMGYGNQMDPYAKKAAIEGKLGNQASQQYGDLRKDFQAYMENERKAQEAYQENVRKKELDYNKALSDYESQSRAGVSDRRSFGQKIAGAIAMGLGAYASAINRTPNYAMQIINESMERDYQEQKDQIDRAKGRVGMVDNELSRLQRMFQNDKLARSAFMDLRFKDADLAIKGFQESVRGEQAKADADIMRAQLAAQAEDNKIKRTRDAAEAIKAVAEAQALGGEGTLGKRDVVLPGGMSFRAKDDNSAKEATEAVQNAGEMLSTLQKMKDLRDKKGAEFLDRDAVARGDLLQSSMQNAIRVGEKVGTLDKGSSELLGRMVKNPTGVGFVSGSFDELEKIIKDKTRIKLQGYGATPEQAEAALQRFSGVSEAAPEITDIGQITKDTVIQSGPHKGKMLRKGMPAGKLPTGEIVPLKQVGDSWEIL